MYTMLLRIQRMDGQSEWGISKEWEVSDKIQFFEGFICGETHADESISQICDITGATASPKSCCNAYEYADPS